LATVLVDMIGAWQVLEDVSPEPVKEISGAEVSGGEGAIKIPPAKPVGTTPEFPVSSDAVEPEVLERLIEIKARFQAHSQAAKIEIKAPDFAFPAGDFEGQRRTDAATLWSRIKDRYEYAAKINELSAKFGRIQPIINDLRTLADWFPTSPAVKRHLAYFHWLSGSEKEALGHYKDAAIASDNGYDWYNVAVLALKANQTELACFGLEQFFRCVAVTEEPKSWYVYVELLDKVCNYSALTTLLEAANRSFSEEEGDVLLETGIYLLQVTNNEQAAKELVQKWLGGQPPRSLALEGFRQLGEIGRASCRERV
jgi:tetratricopeptide (TPR) repeat protein